MSCASNYGGLQSPDDFRRVTKVGCPLSAASFSSYSLPPQYTPGGGRQAGLLHLDQLVSFLMPKIEETCPRAVS